MAAFTSESGIPFALPDGVEGELPKGDQKVCVVSIFGKSTRWQSKGALLNKIVNADAFLETSDQKSCDKTILRGYYDVSGQAIYLELVSACDMTQFLDFCENAKKDYFSAWDSEVYKQARALVLLFHVSHIMVLYSPGSCLDISYIRLFRSLDAVRHKLQPYIMDILQEFSLPSEWIQNGRPCSPRMLFVFERCYLPAAPANAEESKKKPSAVKKMQHCIEDQIYGILRKSRIITNISNHSLFAVPANEEFVYVLSQKDLRPDNVSLLLSLMSARRKTVANGSMGNGGDKAMAPSTARLPMTAMLAADGDKQQQHREGVTSSLPTQSYSFKEFLLQHVERAVTKGFDDNVGRNPTPPAAFELAAAKTWLKICRRLYDMLISVTHGGGPKVQAALAALRASLEIDKRFSENRCSKVMSLAENAYQEGLPKHYTQAVHLAKLSKARSVLLHGGRGPALGGYVRQLEESCERHWRGGRQLCEEVSLTGNHCVHELHRTPDADITDSNDKLPCKQHASQVSFRATCNCGWTQGMKDDPFDLQYANSTFYINLEQGCCDKLEQILFPIFVPSTPDVTPVAHSSLPSAAGLRHPRTIADARRLNAAADTLSERSYVLSLSQGSRTKEVEHLDLNDRHGANEGEEASAGDRQLAEEEDEEEEAVVDQEQLSQTTGGDEEEEAAATAAGNEDSTEEAAAVASAVELPAQQQTSLAALQEDEAQRGAAAPLLEGGDSLAEFVSRAAMKASTTEYLPYMINNCSPPGLLPKFSSWSLKCLGKYSQYVPNMGLEQPGFCSGSNHLLPWDVVVKTTAVVSSSTGSSSSKDGWPSIGEAKQKKKPKKKEMVEVNVHIYIGDEYECPKGHRFFCSGPEKIIKVATSSVVKDNANRLLTMDMPLYFPCQCRSTTGCMAQLMRVYIATPDTPNLTVTVYPKIQPAPAPCPLFVPSHDGPIKLPRNGLWVLRLPYLFTSFAFQQGACMLAQQQMLHVVPSAFDGKIALHFAVLVQLVMKVKVHSVSENSRHSLPEYVTLLAIYRSTLEAFLT